MSRTKGSKNKPKHKSKPKDELKLTGAEKRVALMDEHNPMRTCFVCERDGRDLQMIGPMRFRHADGCEPGSANWAEYYERLKKPFKTFEGDLLYQYAKGKHA
jgi:hypothetical protein